MLAALSLLFFAPSVLEVGPGKEFPRIEAALTAAKPGDTIRVFPSPQGYAKTALNVRKSKITIEAASEKIVLDGEGFNFSGEGPIPRAIVQFESGVSECTIKGFILKNAHNQSYNGAGVRINDARDITIQDCEIMGNDMGVMSNGANAVNQKIDHCHIHHNGAPQDPGYNHNLYLGGWSVTVSRSEIHHSLTGHDLKSRAHFTLIQDCSLHDSANREIDLVEAEETTKPNSNAVILNCQINKISNGGNGNTIHFGREKGSRNGTIYVIGTTITTESMSPVLMLSDTAAKASFQNSIVQSTKQANPVFVGFMNGAGSAAITGVGNWIDKKYASPEATPLRLQNQDQFPDLFSNSLFRGVYTDGDGKKVEVQTTLGFHGKALWL